MLLLIANSILLHVLIKGYPLIEAVNAQFSTTPTCYDYFTAREINDYYHQQGFGGDLIYIFSNLAPIWLLLSAGMAIRFSAIWQQRRPLCWLPAIVMMILIALLIWYLPIARAISCGIE